MNPLFCQWRTSSLCSSTLQKCGRLSLIPGTIECACTEMTTCMCSHMCMLDMCVLSHVRPHVHGGHVCAIHVQPHVWPHVCAITCAAICVYWTCTGVVVTCVL